MNDKYLEIIKAPIITEKASELEKENKYMFLVSEKANKAEVKKAIEKIFNVDVLSINIMKKQIKRKRIGRYAGLTNRGKKAIVKLKEGQTIELK